MLTDFQNSFTGRLVGKFATNSYLNIPPHVKYVATLPCEMWISENWHQSEICIVINDKLQGTTAKHFSYEWWVTSVWINHSVCWLIFFKSVNIRWSYRQNDWLCHTPHVPHSFVLKDADCRTRQISEITCVWPTETVINCCCVTAG